MGRRRIDDRDDPVRTELRTAFERGIRVVPVLLDHAVLLPTHQLPEDIREWSGEQAWWIRCRTLEAYVDRLVQQVTSRNGCRMAGPSEFELRYPPVTSPSLDRVKIAVGNSTIYSVTDKGRGCRRGR